MMKSTARILMPATTGMNGSPNKKPPFFYPQGLVVSCSSPKSFTSLARELVPPPHIRDALLISLNHHFSAFFNSGALIGARTKAAPHSAQRENHLAGAILANGNTDCSEG